MDPPAGGTGNEPEPAIGTPEPTTDPGEPEATPGDVPDDADEPLPTTGGAGGTPASAGGTGTGIGGAGTGDSASAPICERWLADRADLSESDWNGDVATCDAGEMEETARANALRMVNLYRFMAGLAPVEMTDETNRLAQSCALLMRANDNLSHSPDDTWTCYKEEAADAAGSSSLSTARTVAAVDGYMVDRGSEDSMGHRRWILSNWLTGVGFGSADNYSCQYQPAGRGAADAPPWVAWPSPGQVPIQALSTLWATVDETGWSVQSDDVDLDEAQVTVMSDGVELPVETMQLGSGYGSTYALRFVPMGWESEVGKTYRVVVSGGSEPLEYDVEVVGCE